MVILEGGAAALAPTKKTAPRPSLPISSAFALAVLRRAGEPFSRRAPIQHDHGRDRGRPMRRPSGNKSVVLRSHGSIVRRANGQVAMKKNNSISGLAIAPVSEPVSSPVGEPTSGHDFECVIPAAHWVRQQRRPLPCARFESPARARAQTYPSAVLARTESRQRRVRRLARCVRRDG